MADYFLNNYNTSPLQKALFPIFSVYSARHFAAARQTKNWSEKIAHIAIALIDWSWPAALIEKSLAKRKPIVWKPAQNPKHAQLTVIAQGRLIIPPAASQTPDHIPRFPSPQGPKAQLKPVAPLKPSKGQKPEAWFHNKEREFIKEAYKSHQGIVVGESHNSRASMLFVIDNLDLLSNLGVECIGLELKEEDFSEIDCFFSNSDPMPNDLKYDLLSMDARNIAAEEFGYSRKEKNQRIQELIAYERTQKYNTYNLLMEARKRGFRVMPIDGKWCATSNVGDDDRVPVMNEFAERKIREKIKSEKYLLVVGFMHATPDGTEPGLGIRLGIPVFRTKTGPERIVTNNCTPGQFKPDYFVQYKF